MRLRGVTTTVTKALTAIRALMGVLRTSSGRQQALLHADICITVWATFVAEVSRFFRAEQSEAKPRLWKMSPNSTSQSWYGKHLARMMAKLPDCTSSRSLLQVYDDTSELCAMEHTGLRISASTHM